MQTALFLQATPILAIENLPEIRRFKEDIEKRKNIIPVSENKFENQKIVKPLEKKIEEWALTALFVSMLLLVFSEWKN